jgi:DNA-binding NarL/FixJ family response regulator
MIVSQLMRRRRVDSPVDTLSAREREVLAAMAEGRSNAGIAHQLFLSERTVESLSAQIFAKLGLEQSPNDNRRVLAVLQALRD